MFKVLFAGIGKADNLFCDLISSMASEVVWDNLKSSIMKTVDVPVVEVEYKSKNIFTVQKLIWSKFFGIVAE